LDENVIETILRALRPYPYGWQAELPAPYCFFGQPITVTIETRPSPEEIIAPPPIQSEVDLIRLILSEFPRVLVTAAMEYAAYNSEIPELLRKVCEPRVWVCREFQEMDGLDRWAFVSGISDAPDWTIFIEFRGGTFLEVWSGD
jgi:hypothetical protein